MSVTLEDASQHLKHIGYSNTFASNVILTLEALERGITVSKSERFNNLQLKFDGRVHKWRAGRNSLNSALAKRVTRFKDVTSALLRSQGANAAENILIAPGDVDRAWRGPARSTQHSSGQITRKGGKTAKVAIGSEEAFRECFAQVSGSGDGSVHLERFYRGKPHRCVLSTEQ